MGSRFEEARHPWYIHHYWYNKAGTGRYYKAQLARARRRRSKAILRGETHPRSIERYESMVAYRGD